MYNPELAVSFLVTARTKGKNRRWDGREENRNTSLKRQQREGLLVGESDGELSMSTVEVKQQRDRRTEKTFEIGGGPGQR